MLYIHSFTGDGSTKLYSIPSRIINERHVEVYVNVTGGTITNSNLLPANAYDVAFNSIVFKDAPIKGATIQVRTATNPDELLEPLTGLQAVAASLAQIQEVADNLPNILVASSESLINAQAASLSASQADAAADSAALSATSSAASANEAQVSATTAIEQATLSQSFAASCAESATASELSKTLAEEARDTTIASQAVVQTLRNESLQARDDVVTSAQLLLALAELDIAGAYVDTNGDLLISIVEGGQINTMTIIDGYLLIDLITKE